jgi:hypothetical protein
MKTQQYQPVNEWNYCEETPPWAGDQAWNNVVPDTRRKRVTYNPDGDASTLIETANDQYAGNFAISSTNQPNLR